MCIRDSTKGEPQVLTADLAKSTAAIEALMAEWVPARPQPCLLYTSDAADERSSVDLGGRRIIKKKKYITHVRQ